MEKIRGYAFDGRNSRSCKVFTFQNAHVDLSTYSFGRDGILYKCDVEREWQKFKIVSDEDEKKHYTKSLAMKDKLMTLKGKVDTVSVARKTGYLSMSPPRFGISSRSMKIEKVCNIVYSLILAATCSRDIIRGNGRKRRKLLQ